MKLAVVIISFCVLLGSVALAQAAPNRGARNYDPATVTTLTGVVQQVIDVTHGRRAGLHLLVNTGGEAVEVHVGPAFYVSAQKITFKEGDQVEVNGSKIKIGGKDAVIAREIKKEGATLTLRDESGIPQWSRGR